MRRRHKVDLYSDLNVTPLMDLAWTLLVVFIIMATATVQGINVDLPKASAAPSLAKPRTKAITIANDGRIYLDTTRVSLLELESTLQHHLATDPELPVVVKGDKDVRYQLVMEVLDIVKRLGISNLGLVTQRLVK